MSTGCPESPKLWESFDQGASIGTQGSENGTIIRDDEHTAGARITLEENGHQPFGITCGVYGLMVLTAFASTREEADIKYEAMRSDIGKFLERISDETITEDESMSLAEDWCSEFAEKYY